MTAVEVATLLYLVVGLVYAAVIFDGLTGRWERDVERKREQGRRVDKELALSTEIMRRTRLDHPFAFGTLVGCFVLVLVLAWPVFTAWWMVDELRDLWDRRPCRCAECKAERKASR